MNKDRLSQSQKDVVIKKAGPHRSVEFRFRRADGHGEGGIHLGKRAKLICIGAKIR